MNIFFIQLGMMLTAFAAICFIVFLCVTVPRISDTCQLVAMGVLMFGNLIVGLIAIAYTGNPLPGVVGAILSYPVVVIVWPHFRKLWQGFKVAG